MIEELRKDEAMPLPDQISGIIRSRIENGIYRPGKKLDTVRKLARDLSVSQVTVIKALDILEEETLIERVPVKGVFVSERLNPARKQLNACFAFPEKEMAPENLGNENWGLDYELYRGLFAGSQQYGINLQFTYFKQDPSAKLLESQKAALRKFDLVIFPGDVQLVQLREASAQERLTCYVGTLRRESSSAVKLDYDRPDARDRLLTYFLETGCRDVAALVCTEQTSGRGRDFLDNIIKSGVRPADARMWEISKNGSSQQARIRQFLRKKTEFIFVDDADIMPLFYETAFELGLTPGKDFILTAIASGMTFTGLFPHFSYFRIPRYEMGLQLMKSADEIIRSGKITGTVPRLKTKFIQAQNESHIKRKVSA